MKTTLFIRYFSALLTVCLCCDLYICAQNTYSCDFEDDIEITKNWVLNAGAYGSDCVNKWVVDSVASNGGTNGLYISFDDGKTAGYVASEQTVVAYCTVRLPAGTYELGFDWMAGDNLDNALYVCWVPDNIGVYSVITGQMPSFVNNYALKIDGSIKLSGCLWNSAHVNVLSDGSPSKLVFAFKSGHSNPINPGACIDNINIIPLNFCPAPTDLSISATRDRSIVFSWKGEADSYDVRFHTFDNKEWVLKNGVRGTSVTVAGLDEGAYSFYVRANCGDGYSLWVSYSSFVGFVGTRCIDYLVLNKNNCFHGTTALPSQNVGVVDFGYKSDESRHTIHYDKTERDRLIGCGLKTIPDGEVASVRLGNKNVGAQAEGVRYKYRVDASVASVLLLKYAVVLEDPQPRHDLADQPRFTMHIKKNGESVDEFGCGEANFAAGYDTEGWDSVVYKGNPDTVIFYKDWTTVGVNLQEFDGQDLDIELITYDCNAGAHFGYAYFTLGCIDGKLSGVSCGPDQSNVFTAPEGFMYRWYKKGKETETISEERTMTLSPTDTNIYYCDVIQPTNAQCHYTLEASAMPRYPFSDAEYSRGSKECRNLIDFNNLSRVIYVSRENDTVPSDLPCESVLWDFGDGTTSTEWSPSHEYPVKGGQYTVTLQTGLSDDLCISTYSFVLDLPELGIMRDTATVVTCYGVPYKDEKGNIYYEPGFFDEYTTDETTGCEFIKTVEWIMLPRKLDTICHVVCTDNLPYIFNGKNYTETGFFRDTLVGEYGCDSIICIDLRVTESLDVEIPDEVRVCADDAVAYVSCHVNAGEFTTYSLRFDDVAVKALEADSVVPVDDKLEIAVTDGILPGCYQAVITFDNVGCTSVVKNMTLRIDYPDTIVVQRWNDVLAVTNGYYNGGYEFKSFQWYKNGQPIEGEINSILYSKGGLDVLSEYSVLLTRASDGVAAFTCVLTPESYSDLDNTPVVIFGSTGIDIHSEAFGVMRIISVSGLCFGEYQLCKGFNSVPISVPAGVYILEIKTETGHRFLDKMAIGN